MSDLAASREETRACTCHPDDRPPICWHRHATSECLERNRVFDASIHASTKLRIILQDAGLPWPHTIVDDLEEWLETAMQEREAAKLDPIKLVMGLKQ